MNVVVDRTEAVLSHAGGILNGAARFISRREVLNADDVSALRSVIANARASLDEAEVTATTTGLTIPGATWEDRNALIEARQNGASASTS